MQAKPARLIKLQTKAKMGSKGEMMLQVALAEMVDSCQESRAIRFN